MMKLLISLFLYWLIHYSAVMSLDSNGHNDSYNLRYFSMPIEDEYLMPGDIPILNRKIFRGVRVSIREHPYIASIRRNYAHFSMAVLLTKNLFISVAHNLINVPISELTIVVGENYADRGTLTHTIVILIVHEDFDPYTLNADIALIRIYEDISFRGSVKSIRLVAPRDQVNYGTAFITGWGRCDRTGLELCLPRSTRYYPDEKLDPMLRSVSFQITSPNLFCDHYARHNILLRPGMMCLGTARDEDPVCPCLAVPGAPLVFKSRLAGLQSWGFGCGYNHDLPLVYTDIRHYQPWLIHNIPIVRSISKANLTRVFKATRAQCLMQWFSMTRLIVPKMITRVDKEITPTKLDKVLATLWGTVYDIRDFIDDRVYRNRKAAMFDDIKSRSEIIKTLISQRGLKKGRPFLSNITFNNIALSENK